jgi:hypothetical protein
MNQNQESITSFEKRVRLPKPDVANITVLAHNLPDKPILPWNRFDSTRQVDKREQKLHTHLSNSLINYHLSMIIIALLVSSLGILSTSNPTEEKQPN